jgi:hypothetical protein
VHPVVAKTNGGSLVTSLRGRSCRINATRSNRLQEWVVPQTGIATTQHRSPCANVGGLAKTTINQSFINNRSTTMNFVQQKEIEDCKKISAYVSRVPRLYRRAFQKSLDGKSSPRQAIKQKCLDCCCFQRKEVDLCGIETCPLYAYKPVYDKKPSEAAGLASERTQGVARVGSDGD